MVVFPLCLSTPPHTKKLVCSLQCIQMHTSIPSSISSSLTPYLPPAATPFLLPFEKGIAKWSLKLVLPLLEYRDIAGMWASSLRLFCSFLDLRWGAGTNPCLWDVSVPLGRGEGEWSHNGDGSWVSRPALEETLLTTRNTGLDWVITRARTNSYCKKLLRHVGLFVTAAHGALTRVQQATTCGPD